MAWGFISLLALLWSTSQTILLHAEEHKPPAIGNFSVPTSRQPSPLFSIGQTIVDKGDLFFVQYLNYLQGFEERVLDTSSAVLYGVTDYLSLAASIPTYIRQEDGEFHSSGLGDMLVQVEGAFYSKSTDWSTTQATVLGQLLLPTGSFTKTPPTGAGTPSVLLGTTLAYLSITSYLFTSYAVLLRSHNGPTNLGNQFAYEFGIGHNLGYWHEGLLVGTLEIDGIYTQRTRVDGQTDCKSGFNVVFGGPSIFLSLEHLIVQAGIQLPFAQKFNDGVTKLGFRASFGVAVLF